MDHFNGAGSEATPDSSNPRALLQGKGLRDFDDQLISFLDFIDLCIDQLPRHAQCIGLGSRPDPLCGRTECFACGNKPEGGLAVGRDGTWIVATTVAIDGSTALVDLTRRNGVGICQNGPCVFLSRGHIAFAHLEARALLGEAPFLTRSSFGGTHMASLRGWRPTVVQRIADRLFATLAPDQTNLAEPSADAILRCLVILDERMH